MRWSGFGQYGVFATLKENPHIDYMTCSLLRTSPLRISGWGFARRNHTKPELCSVNLVCVEKSTLGHVYGFGATLSPHLVVAATKMRWKPRG